MQTAHYGLKYWGQTFQARLGLLSVAKKLRGFDVKVLCHDILENVGDANAKQVTLEELLQQADVLSLHIPWTPKTNAMIDTDFINAFSKPFWLLNTARGKNVVTSDLVTALKSGKTYSSQIYLIRK